MNKGLLMLSNHLSVSHNNHQLPISNSNNNSRDQDRMINNSQIVFNYNQSRNNSSTNMNSNINNNSRYLRLDRIKKPLNFEIGQNLK